MKNVQLKQFYLKKAFNYCHIFISFCSLYIYFNQTDLQYDTKEWSYNQSQQERDCLILDKESIHGIQKAFNASGEDNKVVISINDLEEYHLINNKRIIADNNQAQKCHKDQKLNPLSILISHDQPVKKSQNATISPFIYPINNHKYKNSTVKANIYYGYQEYDFENKGKLEYTTIYFFKIENEQDNQFNYYHEIVVQSSLKKFYFSVMIKKLIGLLRNQFYQTFNIYCSPTYYEHLMQVTNNDYKGNNNTSKRSFNNLSSARKFYNQSKLQFHIIKTDNKHIEQQYLSQKHFPSNFSSIRIPNQYSEYDSEDFLDSPDFNNYLSSGLRELYNQSYKLTKNDIFKFSEKQPFLYDPDADENDINNNFDIIIPYYDSPVLRRERSRSRSPLKSD